MEELKQYTIPISGLKAGLHTFDFQIDSRFFSCYEASPFKTGLIDVKFYFDKQSGMYTLIFELDGQVPVECDRCLETFDFPVKASHSLIAKFDESEADGAEVIYISKTETEINIADFIYEFIVLSVPTIRKHEDAGSDCPRDVFEYLDDETDEDEEPKNNPFLDAFKDFKGN